MPYTWTDPTGAAVAIYSVDGSAGIMTLDNTDNEGTQVLVGLGIEECEITFTMDWVSGGAGELTPGVYYRASSDLSTFFKVEFSVTLDLLAQDEITAITLRNEAGILDTVAVAKTHTIGVPFRVKVRSTQNHYVKVWSSNQAEPAGWDLVAGGGSTRSGTVGLAGFTQLDAPIPDPLEAVSWMWGGEQAVTGIGESSGYGSGIVTTSSGALSYVSGQGVDGVGYSIDITLANNTGSFRARSTGGNQWLVIFYIRFVGSLPTGGNGTEGVELLRWDKAAGGDTVLGFDVATSRFQYSTAGAVTATGPVASPDTWYRIETTADMSANPQVFAWTVNNVAQTSHSVASAATTLSIMTFGVLFGNTTGTLRFDNCLASTNIAQYPIEDSIDIKRIVVAGTITQGGTADSYARFQNNGSSLDSTFSSSDIMAIIGSFPPPSQGEVTATAAGYHQRTSGSGNTLTIPFENMSLGAGEGIAAVRVYVLGWASSTGGNDITFNASSGGGATTIYTGSTTWVPQTLVSWVGAMYEPSGNWDLTKLNDLNLIQVGSTDISPLPGVRFIMAEVAVRTAGGAGASTIDLEFDDFQVCSCEVE